MARAGRPLRASGRGAQSGRCLEGFEPPRALGSRCDRGGPGRGRTRGRQVGPPVVVGPPRGLAGMERSLAEPPILPSLYSASALLRGLSGVPR